MKEGWHNDDYLILFEGSEAEEKERDYEIDRLLPGHRLLGIVGWDYFLVSDRENHRVFRVPTIPLILEEKEEWLHELDSGALKPDERFQGKIKWYVKPIVFGGDPDLGPNLVWISHEDHVQCVKYWNQIYSQIVPKQSE